MQTNTIKQAAYVNLHKQYSDKLKELKDELEGRERNVYVLRVQRDLIEEIIERKQDELHPSVRRVLQDEYSKLRDAYEAESKALEQARGDIEARIRAFEEIVAKSEYEIQKIAQDSTLRQIMRDGTQ